MLIYVLPKKEAIEEIKGYFSTDREFLEELFLATTSDVVMDITEDNIKELKDNVELWVQGYAIPLEVLEEARRIKAGELSTLEFKEDFEAVLTKDDLKAEPDANHEYSEHFAGLVEGKNVLDIASGFGWIPVFLSRNKKVFALDYSYNNRIIYDKDRTYIEDTTIELFSGYPEGIVFIQNEKLETYADFSELFWRAHGAEANNITVLQGNARNLKEALSVRDNMRVSLKEENIEAVTCFFGLNHIAKNWEKVIREIYSLLKEGGTAYFALYSEFLEKFPLKGFYDWTAALEIEIIPLKRFLEEVERVGFKYSIVKHPRTDLYTIVILEK